MWVEFIAYQTNLLQVLAALHTDAFTHERYFDRVAYYHNNQPHQPFVYPKPVSIDDLLDRVGNGRTHSVLDITQFSTRWDEGAARALSPAQLRRYVRTERPSEAIALARAERIAEIVPSECACYFAIFTADVPTQWCMIGVTGDG